VKPTVVDIIKINNIEYIENEGSKVRLNPLTPVLSQRARAFAVALSSHRSIPYL
jgi:hypothetical protein